MEERGLRWGLFLGALTLLVYVCLSILRPFAQVIAWSSVLAIIADPMHRWLVQKTRRRALSASVTSLVVVFAVVVPLVVIGSVAANQGLALGRSVHTVLQSPDQSLARAWSAAVPLAARLGVDRATAAGWLEQHRAGWIRSAGQHTLSFAAGLAETTISSLFVVVSLFLILRDGDRIVGTIVDLLPFEERRSARLLTRIKDVVQASVYGVVVIALMNGSIYLTAFWLLSVPSAALWGMATVLASVVPVVGTFAVWGPVAVYLAVSGHWPQVLLLAGTAAIVSAIDHVLRPHLVAGRVGLSELAMFFALLGGLGMFGALGVVLGPVAFATAAAVVDALREPNPSPQRSPHEQVL